MAAKIKPKVDLNNIEDFIQRFDEWRQGQGVTNTTASGRILGGSYGLDALRRRHARLVSSVSAMQDAMISSPFSQTRKRRANALPRNIKNSDQPQRG